MHSHSFGLPEITLILVVVAVIFWTRRQRGYLGHLRHELLSRFLVYSAETTRGKEAEFIRERLPRKIPMTLIVLLALGVFGAVAWLSMR
jgi:hypothetical protein